MPRKTLVAAALIALPGVWSCGRNAAAAPPPSATLTRGAYLANYGGCGDCHTPKLMTPDGPVPDTTRTLAGHLADAAVPPVPPGLLSPTGWASVSTADLTAWAGPWGTSFAANLTPDATGLGAWNEDGFIATMRTGKHLGVGRPLLPPMPWFDVAALSDEDLRALFAYLHSLRPVHNPVPPPLPPPGDAK